MASVTFPANLGGSGQTISDDADPNTGLYINSAVGGIRYYPRALTEAELQELTS